MHMTSTQKNAKSQSQNTEVLDFASWTTEQLIQYAHDSLKKINNLEEQVTYMRQDLRSALQAYRTILKEQQDQKSFTSKT